MTSVYPESRAGPSDYLLPPFAVSVRSNGASTLVVDVRGELDLATVPMLQQHLRPFNGSPNGNGHPRKIIYQLSDLRFMDATGLTALLTAIDGHGPPTITVREPSPPVRRVLELVGLGSMIEDPAHGATDDQPL